MKYYYFINSFNNRKGPFRIDELHNYNILRTTLVWCEGMPNWQPAGQVPELAFLFQSQNYGQGYSQSYTQAPRPMSNKPDSYLVWSILNLIFCNLFVGIAALVFSILVEYNWDRLKYEQAASASKNARLLNIIGLVLGILSVVVWIVIWALYGFTIFGLLGLAGSEMCYW